MMVYGFPQKRGKKTYGISKMAIKKMAILRSHWIFRDFFRTVQAVNPLWIPVVNAIKHGIPSQPLGLGVRGSCFPQETVGFLTGDSKKSDLQGDWRQLQMKLPA
jgi:hypothetical protein